MKNDVYLLKIMKYSVCYCFWVKKIANFITLQQTISKTPRYMGVWAFGDASLPIWVIAHVPFLWATAANRYLLTSNIML